MHITGGVPPQPKTYRCRVGEDYRMPLPMEVCQALQVRPGHQVDLLVQGDWVEMRHAWPCCQLCGGSKNLRIVRPSFLCEDCVARIRALDLALPPLPEDAGLREG